MSPSTSSCGGAGAPRAGADPAAAVRAVEAAGIGLLGWDPATGAVWCDEVARRLFAAPEGELRGVEDLWRRVHPDDRTAAVRDVRAAAGGTFHCEVRVDVPDDGTRWVTCRGAVLAEPQGRRVVAVAFDSSAVREDSTQALRVLASMATGLLLVDRDWRVTYLNPEGERILGVEADEVQGKTLWRTLPAAGEPAAVERYRRVLATGVPESVEEHHPDLGAWFEVRVEPAAGGLAVSFLDVTARRTAQESAQAAARRLELLSSVSEDLAGTLDLGEALDRLARSVVPRLADFVVITVADDAGTMVDETSWHVEAEQRATLETYTQVRMAAMTDRSFFVTAIGTGDPVIVESGAAQAIAARLAPGEAAEAIRRLAPESGFFVPLVARGRTVGLLSLYRGPAREPMSEEERSTGIELAARAALAVDNARAYLRAREAAAEAEAASRRLALLARVSEALSTTLDGAEAVSRLARLVVPQLGDWCVVSLSGASGGTAETAWSHRDQANAAAVEEFVLTHPEWVAAAPVAEALRTGFPVAVRDADEAAQALAGADLSVLAPSGLTVAPLVARGRVLGVLALVTGAEREPHDDDEVETATEAARRAGLALDNVRLYAHQRSQAEELQRSLLTEPPEPDHVQIEVRYVPASEEAQVGGDWYDAFLQPEGASVLVIGDVVGHDMRAAAAMGQVRSLLRAIAYTTNADPHEVLSRLDAALEGLQVGTTATAVVARLEQTADERARGVSRVRWSNAGHPPPMTISPDGAVAVLAGVEADLLLGFDPAAARSESETVLQRGSTLLLYTDGLVERRGQSLDDGLVRLRELLSSLAHYPLDELCDEVLRRLRPESAEDDVALVAVRLHRQDVPRPGEAGPERTPSRLPRGV
ncbi:PAS domain S-box-containing protein [Motilibacter peucedani]|uniref:protein-serine/threonine phosphatase n=1 Tax=Motilibacter peucedani TaxID=598650 RepID=A0A420XRV2_9ACTN|nr:SpoIIE family protein phosphatase [Motilibacter peucedani]RKS77531.1 PAS domain S-box-containing protein [Motilibacter peucedani]